jgi:DNA polymerase V
VKHLERSAGLIALSANFELYGDMSSRMMAMAARYAPRQEIYSIDECFLDFEGVPVTLPPSVASCDVRFSDGWDLPTSVGFGPTKTLAKLANHVAKTADRKPGTYPQRLAQVCDFGSLGSEELDDVMRRTDVGDIWGVGRKTAPKLHDAGYPDRARPQARRRCHLGAAVQRGHAEDRTRAAGHAVPGGRRRSARPAADHVFAILRQSGDGTPGSHRGGQRFRHPCGPATARAARGLQRRARVHRDQPLQKVGPSALTDATLPLPRPTADTRALVNAAVTALRAIHKPGYRYVKAGVMLVELQSSKQEQTSLDLFDEPKRCNLTDDAT